MIRPFIFCDYSVCGKNITETIDLGTHCVENSVEYTQKRYLEKNMITINGKIHYCDKDCKESNQKKCKHINSVKDDVQGECLDCGITYANPNL